MNTLLCLFGFHDWADRHGKYRICRRCRVRQWYIQ